MTEFAMQHPVATAFIVCCFLYVIGLMWIRTMRTIMVATRGWPPPHLDADGDFKEDAT